MNKERYIEQLLDVMGQLHKLIGSQESHDEKVATMMQFSALKFLQRHEAETVGGLASHLMLSKSSATQLVERLVKSGFIERRNDTVDGRIVRLHLLPQGREQLKLMERKYIDKMAAIFGKIPDDDLRELIRIHIELINTLQKEKKDTWNR